MLPMKMSLNMHLKLQLKVPCLCTETVCYVFHCTLALYDNHLYYDYLQRNAILHSSSKLNPKQPPHPKLRKTVDYPIKAELFFTFVK